MTTNRCLIGDCPLCVRAAGKPGGLYDWAFTLLSRALPDRRADVGVKAGLD